MVPRVCENIKWEIKIEEEKKKPETETVLDKSGSGWRLLQPDSTWEPSGVYRVVLTWGQT